MSKKKKKSIETVQVGFESPESLKEDLVEPALKDMTLDIQQYSWVEPTMTLADAASRFVLGYKEGWLPSILKFAQNHNHPVEATEESCRALLSRWGATLK